MPLWSRKAPPRVPPLSKLKLKKMPVLFIKKGGNNKVVYSVLPYIDIFLCAGSTWLFYQAFIVLTNADELLPVDLWKASSTDRVS